MVERDTSSGWPLATERRAVTVKRSPSVMLVTSADSVSVPRSASITSNKREAETNPFALAITNVETFPSRMLSTRPETSNRCEYWPAGIVTVAGMTIWSLTDEESETTSGKAGSPLRVMVPCSDGPPSVTWLAGKLSDSVAGMA